MPDPWTGEPGVTLIGLLGPVTVDGTPVPGLRTRRLLVALTLADGAAVTADRLIDRVWGNRPPRDPQAALHTQVSRLRRLLVPAAIDAVGNGYRLTGADTDLRRVRALLAGSEPGAGDAAAGLWRGRPGADLDDDGPAPELILATDTLRERVDDRIVVDALRSGDYSAARLVAERRVRADPLNEPASVLLMRALAGEGRRAEALAQYAALRRALAGELGVEPGAQAAALHRDLLGEPPPVAVAPSRDDAGVGAIPAETTELIGREREIESVSAQLDRHRVVTVLGPGGAGKTRVAAAVGRVIAARGRTVRFVPLAGVRNGLDLIPEFARALGIGEAELTGTGRPRVATVELSERLAEELRGRDHLLILDNCEQVIDACAAMIADLLVASPRLTFLVSSRSPLQITAEQVHPLPALDAGGADSPAARLFIARARAVRPAVVLPGGTVAALCRHLDGLPLAIELAAARVRTLTVDEITARLAERFALLRSTDRTAPDRHRTMHAVIEWSWELLDADARTAARRLCRFPGGFDQAAAQATGMTGMRLDDALVGLANQSLLQVEEDRGRTRYRMLETVREFGEEQLGVDAAEAARTDAAMRAWARDRTELAGPGFRGDPRPQSVMRLGVDIENLVFVLRRAIDAAETAAARGVGPEPDVIDTVVAVFPVVSMLWSMRGVHAQTRHWGGRVIAVLPPPDPKLPVAERERWQACLLAASSAVIAIDDLRPFARARWYLRRLHHPELQGRSPTEFVSGILLSRTVGAGLRKLTVATRAPTATVKMMALGARMNMWENVGMPDRALADHRALRELCGPDDHWPLGMVDVSTASVHGQRGHWAEAASYFRSGIAHLEAIGAEEDALQSRSYLAAVLCSLGDFDGAIVELDRIGGGWRPGEPDPPGGPDVVAGLQLVWAELVRLRGRGDPRLYRHAGELLVREQPDGFRDPGGEMVVAMALAGTAACGGAVDAERLMVAAVSGLEASFGPVGWWDLPQAGGLALALALYWAVECPDTVEVARLLLLGRRLGARQDFPLMYEVLTGLRTYSNVPDEVWAAESERIGGLGRHAAVEDLLRTVRHLRAADPPH